LKCGDDLAEFVEQRYEAEAGLQQLLADHQQLLAGAEIDPDDPRRFVLVRREAPVAALSLDHLFVDQDAILTIVETKRGEDTRGRREIVAQMLDYAASRCDSSPNRASTPCGASRALATTIRGTFRGRRATGTVRRRAHFDSHRKLARTGSLTCVSSTRFRAHRA